MRCLIIDDDESPRQLMARLITEAGHRATVVRTGEEAVAALEREPHDVALVDLEMPGMSGTEVIALLRRIEPQLRVLVVSGHDDRRHVLAALAAGADGYLLKDELADCLGRSLQDLRAGGAPLSARIAAIVLRRARLRDPLPEGAAVARMRPPLGARLGAGTGAHIAIPVRAPDDDPDDS
jgi:DNA-binding NarL/FixJ family response regulator